MGDTPFPLEKRSGPQGDCVDPSSIWTLSSSQPVRLGRALMEERMGPRAPLLCVPSPCPARLDFCASSLLLYPVAKAIHVATVISAFQLFTYLCSLIRQL